MKRIFTCTAMVFGLMAAAQVQAAGYVPVGSVWQTSVPRYSNHNLYSTNGYRYSSNNWSSYNGNTGIVPRGNCSTGNCASGNCASGNCATGNCSNGRCTTGNYGTYYPNSNFYGTQFKGAYAPYYPNRSVNVYNTPYYNNNWNLSRNSYRPLGY